MTHDVEQLLRVFVREVERAIETSAQLFDQSEAGKLPTRQAQRAARSLRVLAAQARQIRPMLSPR